MKSNCRVVTLSLALAAAAALSSGCDRIQTLTAKIKEQTKPKSTLPSTYRADQVSPLDFTSYASFTAAKDRLVIVDFYADWCGPCRKLSPVLEKAAQAHPGVVYVGKVNVDREGKLAAQERVSSIPDVRIFKNGRQVDQFVGYPGEAEVLEKIAALAEGITPAPETKPAPAPVTTVEPMKKDWVPASMEKR